MKFVVNIGGVVNIPRSKVWFLQFFRKAPIKRNSMKKVEIIFSKIFAFFISNPSNHNIIENKLQEIGFTNINFKFSSHGTTVKIYF